MKLRALIDSGSQCSFITENAVQQLRLKREKNAISIDGIGQTSAGTTNGEVNLYIKTEDGEKISTPALILKKLTK